MAINIRINSLWVFCLAINFSFISVSCQAQTTHITEPSLSPNIITQINETTQRPKETQFRDVLKDYQALNQRLSRLLSRLRLANVNLCPKTFRDPGYVTHELKDYPPHMQTMAKEFLGLRLNGIFIQSVRHGSPAYNAQIRPGDEIIAINQKAIIKGNTQSRFYKALAKNAFNATQTHLTLKSYRNDNAALEQDQIYKTQLTAQTACDISASVIFSKDINGHTDGKDIFITSALMRNVSDDLNLSLVLAHEMAHIIAGHSGQSPSEALELEADRMALILLQNAGLDIDRAIEFWETSVHPHRSLQNNSQTHPSLITRLKNFQAEKNRIQNMLKRGEDLYFQ